jgi:hypothetical protein
MKRPFPKDFTGNYPKLAAFKKRFRHCRVPSNWAEDRALASWIERQHRQWERLPMEALAQLFDLGVRFGYRPDQWIARMVDLLAFQKRYGHVNVSLGDPLHRNLAKWCSYQREKRLKLSPGQIRLMNELGFVWDPLRARHLARLEELRAFQRRFGHCDVPRGMPGHIQLATWVSNLRGSEAALPDWLRRELDKMGFDHRPVWERLWEERFAEVARFQEEHGHLRVPYGTVLATWINAQRSKATLISKERRKRLEEIGIDLTPHQTAWNRQFADLERFHRKYGHCNVPGRYAENLRLGGWVNQTRQNAHRLSPAQRRRLNALGFVWSLRGPLKRHSWDWWYEKLVKFQRRHGHCQVPQRSGPDMALSSWVSRMRAGHSKLSKARKRLLDEIGFSWNPLESEWGERYRELAEFKVEHGHCNVPFIYPENPSLGLWVTTQRTCHTRGKLRPDRERMLAALGLVWDLPEEHWSQRLSELQAFRRRFGHCNVPYSWKEAPGLAGWVAKQRALKDRHSQEKIKCLNDLGFEWRPK